MSLTSSYTDLINERIIDLKKDYSDPIYDPVHYILSLPAKRLRPLLVITGAELFGEIKGTVINASIGIELFHNFTLLHDDIMDNAPIRRGKETAHLKWGVNQTILSGDAMMVMAYDHISKVRDMQVFDLFNRVAQDVCIGQQRDIEFESGWQAGVSAYINMIKLKTSVLLGTALQIGSILGGASEIDHKKAFDFGIEIGLAFQIQDDYLDLFGKEKLVGKQLGGDIRSKKKTILILKTLENCNEEEKTEIFRLFEGEISESEVDWIKEIMIRNGIPKIVEELKKNHMNHAKDILDRINANDSSKENLWNLASNLMNRES